MNADDLRQGLGALWGSVADGWERLRRSAAGALTRFKPGADAGLPDADAVDDAAWAAEGGWAMLGGDVFEDDQRVVVRVEAPGLTRNDFDIEVSERVLTIRGEKRFRHERSDGRWRVLQCAYGSFQRRVPLPAAVRPDAARARYRNGVLRIELPKARAARPRRRDIAVH